MLESRSGSSMRTGSQMARPIESRLGGRTCVASNIALTLPCAYLGRKVSLDRRQAALNITQLLPNFAEPSSSKDVARMLERGERFEGRGRHLFACSGRTSRRAALRTRFAQGRRRSSSCRYGSTAGICPECCEAEWPCGALPRFAPWRPASAQPPRTV